MKVSEFKHWPGWTSWKESPDLVHLFRHEDGVVVRGQADESGLCFVLTPHLPLPLVATNILCEELAVKPDYLKELEDDGRILYQEGQRE